MSVSEPSITVSSQADLNNAIETLDQTTTPGNYTIVFTDAITEGESGQPDGIYAITLQSGVTLTIDGAGHSLNGAGSNGGLAVISGDVTIQNLTINDTLAQGGSGQGDGGGGAGLGGGLFVGPTANVTLDNVSFAGDSAQGGAGGAGDSAGAGGNSSLLLPDLGDGAAGSAGNPGSSARSGAKGGPGTTGGDGGDGEKGGAGGDGGDGGDGGNGGYGGPVVVNGVGFMGHLNGGDGGTGAKGGDGGAGGDVGVGGGGGGGGAGGDGGAGGPGTGGGSGTGGPGFAGGDGGDAGDGGKAGDGGIGIGAGGGAGGDGGKGGDGGDGGSGAAGGFVQYGGGSSGMVVGKSGAGAAGGDGGKGSDGADGSDGGQGGFGAGGGGGGAGGSGGNGGDGGVGGGGGGAGYYFNARTTVPTTPGLTGGDGGNGSDGGDGGKGGDGGAGGFGGGGGGGGAGGSGGAGGAGGSGGAGGVNSLFGVGHGPAGANGGSGKSGDAGAAGEPGQAGLAGFGAGSGASGVGGGGLGAGGDIFVAQGGTLTIDGGTLANGNVAGGVGASDGNPGDYNYGSGIFLQGNETITLAATASTPLTVSGVIADQTSAGGTGVNAGTGKLAIGGTGTVTLDADNSFVGGIDIQSGVLDLAHSGAAGAGPISFISSNNDPTLEFSPSSEPGVPIENFGPDDQIFITDFAATDESYSDGTLRLDGVGGPVDLVLSGPGLTSVADFSFSVDSQSDTTSIETAPCYCRGTLIRTALGERPIEDLTIGDNVIIRSGALRPIKWIGQRKVAARFADPLRAWPVRIKAHALAEGVPARDLLLSPDHAILVDDVLVQAGALVNNTSIVRETELPETFTYYHIELDEHALILAENTPAETFIDNVDRLGFDNWQEHEALYPQGRAMAEMSYPRAKAHRQVPRGIRERLSARTIALFGKNSVAA